MNIFRGYTDGLASSYGVAAYQAPAFAQPTSPKPARRSFVKALQAVARMVSKRRGGSPAPSDLSSGVLADFDLFARPATPQLS